MHGGMVGRRRGSSYPVPAARNTDRREISRRCQLRHAPGGGFEADGADESVKIVDERLGVSGREFAEPLSIVGHFIVLLT